LCQFEITKWSGIILPGREETDIFSPLTILDRESSSRVGRKLDGELVSTSDVGIILPGREETTGLGVMAND